MPKSLLWMCTSLVYILLCTWNHLWMTCNTQYNVNTISKQLVLLREWWSHPNHQKKKIDVWYRCNIFSWRFGLWGWLNLWLWSPQILWTHFFPNDHTITWFSHSTCHCFALDVTNAGLRAATAPTPSSFHFPFHTLSYWSPFSSEPWWYMPVPVPCGMLKGKHQSISLSNFCVLFTRVQRGRKCKGQ